MWSTYCTIIKVDTSAAHEKHQTYTTSTGLRESIPLLVFSKTYTTGIGFAPNISYNIIDDILAHFVRSGYLNLTVSADTLRYTGVNGIWWSSRASSTRPDGAASPSAYFLDFTASAVRPSHGPNERHFGFSLRCLSTVLGML